MVDEFLPQQDRQLRYLFLDFNSFFASCQQQEHPELRGKPIAVSPVDSDTSVAVAASYEAKKFGIKCGTKIYDARRMCPELIVVSGNMGIYKAYHEAIIKVAEQVLPVHKVHSVDEMSFRLLGDEREPEAARRIALKIKEKVRNYLGECMTSSVGIAPNLFLAKVATEIQKPDGLVIAEAKDLPGPFLKLDLTDFTGINKRMVRRLNAAMIFSSAQLFQASRLELRLAFGSIIGERWWYLLRGYELQEKATQRKSLGHSHVLSPTLRNPASARQVLIRLLQKAAARLRSESLFTSEMSVYVSGATRSWSAFRRFDATQSSVHLQRELDAVWPSCNALQIRQVGVTFYGLATADSITPSLFSEPQDVATIHLSPVLDKVNQRFGKNAIFLGGIDRVKNSAEEKLAFQKTWLFSEGRKDNLDWETKLGELTQDLEIEEEILQESEEAQAKAEYEAFMKPEQAEV